MKVLFIILIIIAGLVPLMAAIVLLSKEFALYIKRKNILMATIFIIYFSLVGTYLIALFFKNVDNSFVKQVGSADAWIGFAGSALGGLITMLALYFTLKHTEEQNYKAHINSIRPYVSCNITNLDDEQHKLKLKKYINNYDFIKFKMTNISSNIANGIKIKDEYSTIESNGENIKYENLDDWGISIYTVCINDGFFLAPGNEYNWRTNICIEVNDDGTYFWSDPSFVFSHIIVFQYTDISNEQIYEHKFEFTININIDVNNKLHFFLENISNSIDVQNNQEVR